MPNRAEILKPKFTQSLGLPFPELLPQSEIEKVLVDEGGGYRKCVYTPVVTLWVFLCQSLRGKQEHAQGCQSSAAFLRHRGL